MVRAEIEVEFASFSFKDDAISLIVRRIVIQIKDTVDDNKKQTTEMATSTSSAMSSEWTIVGNHPIERANLCVTWAASIPIQNKSMRTRSTFHATRIGLN